ncbi:hypothetical protein TYRP_006480 [Tyrophagus putrescentiae]|nr:hypothetical protein TYRP_006480 [Tyrophagus putrescentiae]
MIIPRSFFLLPLTLLALVSVATLSSANPTTTTTKNNDLHHRTVNEARAELLAQLPKPSSAVTSCPAAWVRRLLQPCACNEASPNQLLCSGESLVEELLVKMHYRIRLTERLYTTLGLKEKSRQLAEGLGQFDTVIIARTGLTRLDTPVFKLFPAIRSVLLDSDRQLREVRLVDTFGRRSKAGKTSEQKIVELDNFFLVNMDNVNIDE